MERTGKHPRKRMRRALFLPWLFTVSAFTNAMACGLPFDRGDESCTRPLEPSFAHFERDLEAPPIPGGSLRIELCRNTQCEDLSGVLRSSTPSNGDGPLDAGTDGTPAPVASLDGAMQQQGKNGLVYIVRQGDRARVDVRFNMEFKTATDGDTYRVLIEQVETGVTLLSTTVKATYERSTDGCGEPFARATL